MTGISLEFLSFHWGTAYSFGMTTAGHYTARASFGAHDALEAGSPELLLTLVRRRYPGTRAGLGDARPQGGRASREPRPDQRTPGRSKH